MGVVNTRILAAVSATSTELAMEFGLSLDALSVPQRHALYDSDEEEEEEKRITSEHSNAFSLACDSPHALRGKTLLLALGTTASVFLRSYLRLREGTVLSLRAEGRALRGKPFSGWPGKQLVVSEALCVEGREECVVCVHEKELQLELCSQWVEKVRKR